MRQVVVAVQQARVALARTVARVRPLMAQVVAVALIMARQVAMALAQRVAVVVAQVVARVAILVLAVPLTQAIPAGTQLMARAAVAAAQGSVLVMVATPQRLERMAAVVAANMEAPLAQAVRAFLSLRMPLQAA